MPEVKKLLECINANKALHATNSTLFNIFEGELLPYVLNDLKAQLSAKSYEQAKHRVPSINVLTKLVDKLSGVYNEPPVRTIEGGSDKDKELLDWYVEQLDLNNKMVGANEFYNLFKNTLIWPYTNEGKPRMRVVPSMSFVPYGGNPKDDTIMTGTILFIGKVEDKDIYAFYSPAEFFIFDTDEKIRYDLMSEYDNSEGVNPIGAIPGTYINSSANLLIPKADSDLLSMTKLLPVLCADMNFIMMFTAFPIRYGIDVDDENLVYSPNAYWSFSSQGDGEKKPEVGTLDAKADLTSMLSIIQAELAMWLSTRGLKPSAIGSLEIDTMANGISKMIDEIDTTEHREKQVIEFTKAENNFWELIVNNLHPYWVRRGLIENKALFTPGIKVSTNFAKQEPSVKRGDTVRDLKEERASGFTSRRRAIKKLNPTYTDKEIDELITEIDTERGVNAIDLEDGEPIDVMMDLNEDGSAEDISPEQAEIVTTPAISLNGAQVSSLLEVIERVTTGQLPIDAAVNIIKIAFALSEENAKSVLDGVKESSAPKGVDNGAFNGN